MGGGWAEVGWKGRGRGGREGSRREGVISPRMSHTLHGEYSSSCSAHCVHDTSFHMLSTWNMLLLCRQSLVPHTSHLAHLP